MSQRVVRMLPAEITRAYHPQLVQAQQLVETQRLPRHCSILQAQFVVFELSRDQRMHSSKDMIVPPHAKQCLPISAGAIATQAKRGKMATGHFYVLLTMLVRHHAVAKMVSMVQHASSKVGSVATA